MYCGSSLPSLTCVKTPSIRSRQSSLPGMTAGCNLQPQSQSQPNRPGVQIVMALPLDSVYPTAVYFSGPETAEHVDTVSSFCNTDWPPTNPMARRPPLCLDLEQPQSSSAHSATIAVHAHLMHER